MRYSSLGLSPETRALWGRTAVGRLKLHEIPFSLVPRMAIITAYPLSNSLHVSQLIFMSAFDNQFKNKTLCLFPEFETQQVWFESLLKFNNCD